MEQHALDGLKLTAEGAGNRPWCLEVPDVLDDGRNWLVSCLGFLNANNSTLTYVTPSQYSTYPIGHIFWCAQ